MPEALPALKTHHSFGATPDIEKPLPQGVLLQFLQKHRDERGFFMEVVRFSSLGGVKFVPQQVSVSETKPGIVKAFHLHRLQSDLFCPLSGRFRIVLLDARPESSTVAHGYSIDTDEANPFLLHIPPGVAHGYQVLGNENAKMLYVMNREYDPADEVRFDWDDPKVGFPWRDIK